jgi:hypothetical protein
MSPLRGPWFVLAAILAAALLAPGAAVASVRVTPQDRSSTRMLLEAQYAYDQARVASAPAATAAVEQFAGRLGGECPGVLAGAPHETFGTIFESAPRSPRQTGEANRESRQWNDLRAELSHAFALQLLEPARQAALAYVRAVGPLRWSSGALTALEHTGVADLEWELQSTPPNVCADMRAWTGSGYKTLSPASKTLRGETAAITKSFLRLVHQLAGGLGSLSLHSYEGPREKALARRLVVTEREWSTSLKGIEAVSKTLESTLGVTSKEAEPHGGPPKGAIVIAHGTTAIGSSYTIWLEPKRPASGPRAAQCRLGVGVEETEASPKTGKVIGFGRSSSEFCLSRSHPEAPFVSCREGLVTIEAQTLPGARTVRLHLSDGRQITSPVAIVPTSLGGPAGFYYQVVRGPSPIPVSLTELDAHGGVLRSVRLPRTERCTRPSPGPLVDESRTIVSGSLPQGPSFSISGERSGFRNEVHFQLSVEVDTEEASSGITSFSGGAGSSGQKSSPFTLEIHTGCQPHEYAILYGVLTAPGDTVLVRVSGSLRPLRRVRIPASLHAHGVLAYIALPSLPSELLVRTPAGRTILTEKLTRRAREARETCEGEAEGPG